MNNIIENVVGILAISDEDSSKEDHPQIIPSNADEIRDFPSKIQLGLEKSEYPIVAQFMSITYDIITYFRGKSVQKKPRFIFK